MAAAEETSQTALLAQGCLLGEHQQMLSDLDVCISQFTTVVSQALLAHPAPTTSALLVPQPDKFSREVSECKGFLLQCLLYFTTQLGTTNQQKIAQFINLLTGKALHWAIAVWEKGGKPTTLYKHFVALFKRVFNHQPEGVEVSDRLLMIQRGD